MKKFKLLVLVFFLCVVSVSYGQWTYTDLSAPKAYMGAISLGSKAYFAGGMNNSGLKSTVEIYDALTGEWDTTQHLSVARDLMTATTCGSKIFFAGGVDFFSSGNVFATVDIYDTLTKQWSDTLLSAARLNITPLSYGNKVLFAGGANPQIQGFDNVDIYDSDSNTWSVTHLSGPRVAYGGVVNNLGILPGGFDSAGVTKRVDIYNFTTGTWSIDSLSVARAWVGVATVGNKMLIAGGVTPDNVQSDVVDIYDATTGTWDTDTLSVARSFADNQNAVTVCGKAYFVGGGILNLNGPYWDKAYDVIDIYDVTTNTWSVDSTEYSYVHRAAVSLGDQFLVAGGITMGGIYKSMVEIYTCPTSGCLPEGITFTTQEQIDNFQANHPGCTEIEGDVLIGGLGVTDITNLTGLNMLTSVGGSLSIINTPLTGLSGLENLNYIGDSLTIGRYYPFYNCRGNNGLVNLNGLNGLDSIGGDLNIQCNNGLTSLTGLESLTLIGGNLRIGRAYYPGFSRNQNDKGYGGNPSLTSLSGLNNLTFIDSSLVIGSNDALTSISALANVTSVGGGIEISFNSTLASLTGLEGLTSIMGDLSIRGADSIVDLTGLNNLCSVGGDLSLIGHNSLANLSGLENLESIGGSLGVCANGQLLSLSGLENLDSIGGWLSVGSIYGVGSPPPPGGNDLLVNFTPLGSLTYLGGGIDIGRNHSLSSLAGLGNINAGTVTDLLIGYNDSLSTCEVKSVCDYLASPNGTVFIQNNATGCNSQAEVQTACDANGLVEVRSRPLSVSTYPNPFSSFTTLEYELEHAATVNLSVFNHLGQQVAVLVDGEQVSGSQHVCWDAEGLPAGIYFVGLLIEGVVQRGVGKLVKN